MGEYRVEELLEVVAKLSESDKMQQKVILKLYDELQDTKKKLKEVKDKAKFIIESEAHNSELDTKQTQSQFTTLTRIQYANDVVYQDLQE